MDSCSWIYLHKIKALQSFRDNFTVLVTSKAATETGLCAAGMQILASAEKLSADADFYRHCEKNTFTAVTDDKKIILRLRKAGLTYYNSWMVLLILLDQDLIGDYHSLRDSLLKIARYSGQVNQYAKDLEEKLLRAKN